MSSVRIFCLSVSHCFEYPRAPLTRVPSSSLGPYKPQAEYAGSLEPRGSSSKAGRARAMVRVVAVHEYFSQLRGGFHATMRVEATDSPVPGGPSQQSLWPVSAFWLPIAGNSPVTCPESSSRLDGGEPGARSSIRLHPSKSSVCSAFRLLVWGIWYPGALHPGDLAKRSL